MLEWITKNQDMILQAIGLSLFCTVVLGLFLLIVTAFIDRAREVKQIEEDGSAKQAESVRTGYTNIDKYFSGMEDAASALKESRSLARVIQATIAYDLSQAGVPGEVKWAAAKAVMRELFDVEIED
jgi:hypothetical protein